MEPMKDKKNDMVRVEFLQSHFDSNAEDGSDGVCIGTGGYNINLSVGR